MSSTSEKGHAKIIDNFSLLIETCKGFGATYNPSKAALKIANLETKLVNAQTKAQTLKDKERDESNARNARQEAFKNKGTFSTKLLAAIKATDATDQLIADAISINKKIQGERLTAAKKATPTTEATTTEAPKTISTSQQSYTNLVDHYKVYKTLITSMGGDYAPNETELQLASLNTFITNLDASNKTVDIAETATSKALIARDKELYQEKTGIPEIAKQVKEYLKSVFGAGSPEFKMVSKISFTYPPKKV